MIDQDVYDIAEHIVHNIKDYIEDYQSDPDNYMSFKSYVRTRVSTELNGKYTKMEIAEAFDDHRICTIVDFYEMDIEDEDDDLDIKILH